MQIACHDAKIHLIALIRRSFWGTENMSKADKLHQFSMFEESKRLHGQYYTVRNPFTHSAFKSWAEWVDLPNQTILEPFAGENSLIDHLESMDLCKQFDSFDINPASGRVSKLDTLASFPKDYSVCITNPPWLAKNSATVRGMPFPQCQHDDLYKYALEKCLDNCEWVAAIIPESFIRAEIFHERLTDFVSMTSGLFDDTGHPVGLALFQPDTCPEVRVWSDSNFVGELGELKKLRPLPLDDGCSVRFNEPKGNVGLIALDNTICPSIRFCEVEELADYVVKKSGRHITKLLVDGQIKIDKWNEILYDFREITNDVLMTCYKGRRKDGKYRRRLDWDLARGIIHSAKASAGL